MSIAPVYRIHTTANDKVLAYLRKNDKHEVLILLNLSNKTIDFKLADPGFKGKFEEIFTKEATNISDETNFKMDAWNFLFLNGREC